jgi:putative nucleotidyltransferase with HDIG domain
MPDKAKVRPISGLKPLKKPEQESRLRVKMRVFVEQQVRPSRLRWITLVFMSLVVAVLLSPNVLTRPPSYNVGDVAGRGIKASQDLLVENKELMEKDREKASREVQVVYDFDGSALNLIPSIREAFDLARDSLRNAVPQNGQEASKGGGPQEWAFSPEFESYSLTRDRFFGIMEIPADDRLFNLLGRLGFSSAVEEAVIGLVTGISERGVVTSKSAIKNHTDKGGIVLHEIYSKKESTVMDSDRFLDLQAARNHIRNESKALQDKGVPAALSEAAVKLAQMLARPNLTFNQRETEARRELAKESVKPVFFKIKKGEMIVREGERIGPEHVLKLEAETKASRPIDLIGRIPAMTILIGILFASIYFVGLMRPKTSADLLFDASVFLSLFLITWTYNFVAGEIDRALPYLSSTALLFGLPVAVGAMLVSIFQGVGAAASFSLILSVFASLVTGARVEFFIYFFVSCLVAAYGVRNCTERVILIKAGLMVGLINIILSLAVQVIYGTLYSVDGVVASLAGFMGGLLAGIVATGVLPLVEIVFGFTTDIKLLELSNMDQPLLKELMVQAPGTYHHSVVISNMVEATAKAVHANPLLAKVSAYYHDIGKMKKPLYFIENQPGPENKHEKLAPSMSSLILISHVKDAVELAREHKLGREIIDIIQQHHGTSLISYFYHKAQERQLSKSGRVTEIKEEDFRYPGPKPQTKEAGLVMLADMVEAASRSLVDPTPARIQGMVQKIINKVFSDGQLDACELALKDLHEIAKSFNKTLSGIFHHRIEYPDTVPGQGKKARNGSSDHAPAEDSGARKPDDKAEVEETLRRLGLS